MSPSQPAQEPGGGQSTPLYRLSECLFYIVYLRGSLALFSFLAKCLERDLQTRVRENADLQQQLIRKEAELTRAEETIGREQQQIQELREQV